MFKLKQFTAKHYAFAITTRVVEKYFIGLTRLLTPMGYQVCNFSDFFMYSNQWLRARFDLLNGWSLHQVSCVDVNSEMKVANNQRHLKKRNLITLPETETNYLQLSS